MSYEGITVISSGKSGDLEFRTIAIRAGGPCAAASLHDGPQLDFPHFCSPGRHVMTQKISL